MIDSPAIENDPIDACRPSPCGPNSVCRDNNGVAICSCSPGFVGSAPACRPECVVSSECSLDKACVNQKCVNPCTPNVCGQNSNCRVNNHSPICTCRDGFIGNPFTVCSPIRMSCLVARKILCFSSFSFPFPPVLPCLSSFSIV